MLKNQVTLTNHIVHWQYSNFQRSKQTPSAIPKRRETDGCEQIHIWFGFTVLIGQMGKWHKILGQSEGFSMSTQHRTQTFYTPLNYKALNWLSLLQIYL